MDNKLFLHCRPYLKLSTAYQLCQNNQHILGAGRLNRLLLLSVNRNNVPKVHQELSILENLFAVNFF